MRKNKRKGKTSKKRNQARAQGKSRKRAIIIRLSRKKSRRADRPAERYWSKDHQSVKKASSLLIIQRPCLSQRSSSNWHQEMSKNQLWKRHNLAMKKKLLKKRLRKSRQRAVCSTSCCRWRKRPKNRPEKTLRIHKKGRLMIRRNKATGDWVSTLRRSKKLRKSRTYLHRYFPNSWHLSLLRNLQTRNARSVEWTRIHQSTRFTFTTSTEYFSSQLKKSKCKSWTRH